MAQTSSVYATLIAGLAPPKFQKDKCGPRYVRPTFDLNDFSAAPSGRHALGSVARNEDSPRRRHRRVASEVLR